MEKEIGKIKKNDTTNIIVRIDEYKGKKGLTIREFVTSERYTGFSKSGTRIPADEFLNFRDMINSVNLNDLTSTAPAEKEAKKEEDEGKLKPEEETAQEEQEKPKKAKKPKKEKIEEQEEQETQEQETVDEAEVKEESEEDKESEEESEEAE